MNISELEDIFTKNADPERAVQMAAYMKNRFPFLGIQKPLRKDLERDFLRSAAGLEREELMGMAGRLASMREREYTYTAQALLEKYRSKLLFEDILNLVERARIQSWWDSVDGYVIVIKKWLASNPEKVADFVEVNLDDPDFWVRRMSIICQLQLKDKADLAALEKAILYNLGDPEFFIQKAIGWILRDVAKTFPDYTRTFVEEHRPEMSNLAIREALKNLS
jgi:3-methyladenine DNA glycosylase AlkD